jgi:hypothetical protein
MTVLAPRIARCGRRRRGRGDLRGGTPRLWPLSIGGLAIMAPNLYRPSFGAPSNYDWRAELGYAFDLVDRGARDLARRIRLHRRRARPRSPARRRDRQGQDGPLTIPASPRRPSASSRGPFQTRAACATLALARRTGLPTPRPAPPAAEPNIRAASGSRARSRAGRARRACGGRPSRASSSGR